MAVLGKRKAPEPSISQEDAAEIFRRHFEAQFKPLAGAETKVVSDDSDGGDDDEDDEVDSDDGDEDDDAGQGEDDEWGGLSEDEISSDEDESTAIEVIDHSASQAPKPAEMSKRELKAFMSSRPPDQTTTPKEPPTTTKQTGPLAEDAPSLLAQDLELRRLIAESHLLSAKPASFTSLSSTAEPRTFTAGRVRQKATDMRVQALGSKTSILKQEKMPMSMRKGMVAASGARETKRRKEAKENGVILERETVKKKGRDRARDGGLDRPGVGKMKGAHLTISDRDVKRIEGTRDTFGRRGGAGKRR